MDTEKSNCRAESLDEGHELKRFHVATDAMLKLMEWGYYRDDRNGQDRPNSGLLTNRKSICAAAVLYADTLLNELEKRP